MPGLRKATALVLLLACPLPGFAFGWRARSSTVTTQYYYPAPVIVQPAPVVTETVVPVLPAYPAPVPSVPLAVPTPAPPSTQPAVPLQTAPPPLAPAPGVSESRSGTVGPATSTSRYLTPTGERVSVAFWNLSGRDVVLTVDGETRLVPRGQNWRLELGRAFSWQMDGKAEQLEWVPAGKTTVELVIRR
jgi:hypothetical protein